MSCEKFDQDEYERNLERYITQALTIPSWADVYVRHVAIGWIQPTGGEREDIMGLEVLFDHGAAGMFAVRVHDWPLERAIEEDLGPRFLQALQLLVDIYVDGWPEAAGMARPTSTNGEDEPRETFEAAERLEPDPQPQTTSPLEKEPADDIF